jgi:hypothetical protein
MAFTNEVAGRVADPRLRKTSKRLGELFLCGVRRLGSLNPEAHIR